MATLLPLGGVSQPSAAQSYGSLTANGAPVERSFVFTATGGCGTFIDPILRLTDGDSFLGYAHFSIPLGTTNQKTFSGGSLLIRDNTTATPYPSTSLVSGLQGRVQNLSVKINGFSHGYPDDVGLLLVSPDEIEQVIMDGATDLPLSKCNFVFDGNAPVYLPFVGSTPSGSYKPCDYHELPFSGDPGFESAHTLGEFNGLPSAGLWKLFAEDFDVKESGSITSWQLVFTAADCTDNVFLTQTNLTFPKDAGTALLSITRTGGREGDASVRSFTVADSATANTDFVPTNGILTFGPRELSKTVAVSLLHHATPNTNRTFFVRLSEAAGNTQLGNATQCVITMQEGDRDGDGLPDDYEIASGFLNPDFAGDAGLDFDRDGSSNFAEYVAGTNPQSDTSVLRLKASQTASILRVQIPTQTGRTYEVETSPDLREWSLWTTGITGTGGTVELLDTSPQSQVQRGYRVKVTLTNP